MSTPICPNCGLPNAAGAPACPRCGAPLGYAQAAPPPQKTGRSTLAIVVGCLAVGLLIVVVVGGIIAAVAVPAFFRARSAANESVAVGRLRLVALAEESFKETHYRYGSLRELVAEDLLSAEIVDGAANNGYRYRETNVAADAFDIAAEPDGGASSGSRSFNVTEDSIVRFREGTVAPVGTAGTPLGVDR